jgi:hypothetical protein
MNTSIYGPYDHVTTDLFGVIYSYFWWLKESLVTLRISPMHNPFLAAPFETKMFFTNLTPFVQLPITVLFGYIFSRNFTILFNLIVSGLGMFLLVRHITKSAGAGFIAGIIYTFCPNMMVRSYTTFDTTQVQWIPLYTLYVMKFIEHRTWKNSCLAGLFLVFHILFTFPYYLVYLPVHTLVLLVAYAAWYIGRRGHSPGVLVKNILSPQAVRDYFKIIVVLGAVLVIFPIYYTTVVGGGATMQTYHRTVEQLEELSLKPSDYFMPHIRSALLKGNIKESYWSQKRPGKDPDSFVAYIGYIALVLMVIGIIKGKGVAKWIFIAGGIVAFWSTLGPKLFGIPTPSGLIYYLYAPFARRVLIYKVFVQMNVACLAGMGVSFVLDHTKHVGKALLFLVLLSCAMIAEYSIVPPVLSVDLTHNPEVYDHIRNLPEDAILIEVPVLRNNGYPYQGYLYYQIFHTKKLFNPHLGVSGVPKYLQPFYSQMQVPMESGEYCNLAAMRYLGVTHLTYHHYIGTQTVIFRSFAAPAFQNSNVEGLKRIYQNNRDPQTGTYEGPYDYTFADLYEITAEPCPIALVFDYHSPYEQVRGALREDFLLNVGWASALFDTTSTFYYPLPHGEKVDRVLRQGGRITAVNMSDKPYRFYLAFSAESPDEGRKIDIKWNNGPVIGTYTIGPRETKYMTGPFRLNAQERGILSIWSTREAYTYQFGKGKLLATAVLRDFRVIRY